MNSAAVRYENVAHLQTRECLYREVLFPRPCATGFDDVGEFFRNSEQSGLIVWLDRAMLEFSLEQLRDFDALRLGVNLSYTSITQSGHSLVARIKSAGVRVSRRLVIEVTETAYRRDAKDIRHAAFFSELRKLGVQIAIDDFGSGCHDTPIPALSMVNADFIKIDGPIIVGSKIPANERRIESAILHGRRSGAIVIAEHIESAEVLDAMRGMGLDYGQGYHLCS